jgi:hypothetical protein
MLKSDPMSDDEKIVVMTVVVMTAWDLMEIAKSVVITSELTVVVTIVTVRTTLSHTVITMVLAVVLTGVVMNVWGLMSAAHHGPRQISRFTHRNKTNVHSENVEGSCEEWTLQRSSEIAVVDASTNVIRVPRKSLSEEICLNKSGHQIGYVRLIKIEMLLSKTATMEAIAGYPNHVHVWNFAREWWQRLWAGLWLVLLAWSSMMSVESESNEIVGVKTNGEPMTNVRDHLDHSLLALLWVANHWRRGRLERAH